ncbi:DUF1835 domain-containing protein [Flavihumibacter profundi]|jgi:hypothetical protein|uniref:DUF1835 domain-containing protein n=1 Tax=Flavihumibacter profundi TaxID=2716883 RepID=UPI001CC475A9|nr:DUF1835 domain-containing protein [Flavihumibacter profundi]MBZ5856283.1 DUF1835 domain-containing protein [Flavihumibacter profundi]
MIHLVFNEADIPVLKQAIEMDESMAGEVVQIKDDYSVGPIENIYAGEGKELRKAWWRNVLSGGDFEGKTEDGEVDDYATIAHLVGTLRRNPDEIVWIWAAQNKHDVSGYYWLLHFLKEFQGRIFILYLNNLPFLNEKRQLFYPSWLHTIPPKEFLKAKKLSRPITLSEFEIDPDEWTRLSQENKIVRILEGGKKLVQYNEDFYDADLSKFITNDWQKAGRIISQFQNKNKHSTGDAYLLWRLKQLAAGGALDVQGEIRNMKDFELKWKGGPVTDSE